MSPLLRTRKLGKSFASPVLKSIDLCIDTGEVVALTGENGAGKSTLSKIIAGIIDQDAGSMILDDMPFSPRDRTEAERLGVRMVLQELSLIDRLSVAENLLLGRMPSRGGFIDHHRMERIAKEQLEKIGLTRLDVRATVADLGVGQQQLIEIARGLMGRVRLLILDEPTAMLTGSETARLFKVIASLRTQGVAVLYISHRLDELTHVSDRVVVLRDGQLVASRPTNEFPREDIVRAMVGRDPRYDSNHPRRQPGERLLLRVDKLHADPHVREVSLTARAGEILGIAGLVGSGRSELLRLIFGASRKERGEVFIGDDTSPACIESPRQAIARGIGMLPEDRKNQGLLLSEPLSTNITLANASSITKHGFIDDGREKAIVEEWIRRLNIRAGRSKQIVSELSGGNQQKALLARWVHRNCRILLLDEPTRGVDIVARADIYRELNSLATSGKALLVVSSDLHELMLISDRIAVMSAGKLVRIFERDEWNEQALLGAALSEYCSSIN